MYSTNKQKNEGSLISRITAAVVLFSLTVNIGAQSIPDSVRGFDRGVYDYHFSTADREMTPEKWLESARRGLSLARSAWERMAADLLCDPAEMADARTLLDEWSEDELERRYAEWIETRFLRREISQNLFNFSNNAENEFLGYYYHLDENGNVIFEESSGDPSVIRPDERNVNEDRTYIENQLTSETDLYVQNYEHRLEYLFPELLAYIDESRRGGLEEAMAEIAHNTSAALRLELEAMAEREDNIFVSRRIADSYSLRNKSESEAARIIAGDLISAAEDVCNQGIAALEEQIEAARAGTGNLALLGQDWLAQYEDQFHRGIKAWEDAEERFFVRRIEWEQEAGRQWTEGEAVWAEAFGQFTVEKDKWEAKAKALFDAGEQLFRTASDDLQRSISAARAEFQRDAEIRAESGKIRAEAYVTSYLTAGSVVAAAQENVEFWLEFFWEETSVRLGLNIEEAKEKLGVTGEPPSLSASGEFSAWFNNLRTQEISVLDGYIQELEAENETLQSQINNLQSQIDDALGDFFRNIILVLLQPEIDNVTNKISDNNQKINNYRAEKTRTDINAETEIKNWTRMYGDYYQKAVEARNALVNDFNLVMGNGALADILNVGVSSEDFNLDEYQVELIRAQAVAGYWDKRVEVARAVNSYAEDLTANRITDAEGIAAWENAKTAYDNALAAYQTAQRALEAEAAHVSEARDALNAARTALEAADNALSELNSQYSLYASLLVLDDASYLLEDIAAKYTELMANSNLLKKTGDEAIYKNYIEKAYTLGVSQFLEAQGLALKIMINGDVSSPSLAALKSVYNAIVVPPAAAAGSQQTVFINIADYGIAGGDMYYQLIQRFMEARNEALGEHDTAYSEMEPAYNEAVSERNRLQTLRDAITAAESPENDAESGSDGADSEVEDGADGEAEDGADGEVADGTDGAVEDGADSEVEDGADSEVEDGADSEVQDGADSEVQDGTDGEVEDGADGEAHDGVDGEVGDGTDGEVQDDTDEADEGEPPSLTVEELDGLIAECDAIIDAYNEMPEIRARIENIYNTEIYTAASTAKQLAETRLNSRLAAINLLTAESTEAWYLSQFEGLTEDQRAADIAALKTHGLEYLLNQKMSTAETRLNEFLNSPECAGMDDALKLFYAKDLLLAYEKINGLNLAYYYAKSSSTALAKEERDLSLAKINSIFSAENLVFITPANAESGTPESMAIPDVKTVADKLFASGSGDAIIAKTADFLNKLDEQFRRLPQEIYSEYVSWSNTFIEYIAAKFIYENKTNTITTVSVEQSIMAEQEYQREQARLAALARTLAETAADTQAEEDAADTQAEEPAADTPAADTQAADAPHGDVYIGLLSIQYRLLWAMEQQRAAAQRAADAAAATEASAQASAAAAAPAAAFPPWLGNPRTPPPLDQKEHWREIIVQEILGEYNKNSAGTDENGEAGEGSEAAEPAAAEEEALVVGAAGSPERTEGIAAAASYAEGALADAVEMARFGSNLFNEVLAKLNTSAYWTVDSRLQSSVNHYLGDNTALWDETHVVYTEYAYKDAFNTEKNTLNNNVLKRDMLKNEILRLGNGYLFAKNDKNSISAEMARINGEMEAMKADKDVLDENGNPTGEKIKGYNTLSTEYSAAAQGFMDAGGVYDTKYSAAKVKYEAMEAAAFEYEKQDAIRRWASTSYLQESETSEPEPESESELDGFLPQYNNPADELAYCLLRQERAGIVLAALTSLYDADAEERPFDDVSHNQIYNEYRQSFQRMMETLKTRDVLLEAIQKETRNNEKLHDEYIKNYSEMTNNTVDTREITASTADRANWSLIDIITTDADGRLVFNRTGFSLSGQSATSAAALTAYFNNEEKNRPEAHKTTQFERAIRELNEKMAGYMTSTDKYKQWGMARDYLIRKLQGGGGALTGAYAMTSDLHSGNLSNMKVSWTNTQVDDIAYSSAELMAVQEQMWNALSAEEKKDLEFYTILSMMGGGVVSSEFASNASMLAEYEYAYDRVRRNYNNTYNDGLLLTCISPFIINPAALVIGIVMLASLGDIGFTRDQLSKQKNAWQGQINTGYMKLSTNITAMDENFDKYMVSSERLSKLIGEVAEGASAGWAEILLSLETAKVSEADISKMQTTWDAMSRAGDVTRYASAQEAVLAMAQWTKNERQDAKDTMERSWTENDEARTTAQANYRNKSDAYIESSTSYAEVQAAAAAAYGPAAAARKTYFGQLGSTLLENMAGVTEDGSAYGGEYSELAGELTALIERVYGTRYQAELQAREAEWSVRQADLLQKYREWRNTADLILFRGREDWNKGADRMRERYAQWQKQFSDEYTRVYEGWETAYLRGLQEKEAWIASATAAAMDASGGAMAETLGVEAEKLSRVFDESDPLGMNTPDAASMSENTLAEIFAGAGIANMASALGTISSAAKTVNTKVRTGLGGNGVWNSGAVQKEARDLVQKANGELAERESKRLAATTRKRAEEMIAGIWERIENQNKSTEEGIDKTFIYEGRWQRKGKNYVKDVLIDSTVIDGPVTERASVEVYKYYIHEDDFAMPSYLDEKELENLESFAINALIRRLNKDVEKFFEDIFGKNDETKDATDQDRGKFGAHVGESASPRSDMKPDMSKGEMFSGGGNGGSGEMGRLFQEYIYWNIREGTGVSSMNAAVWEKSLWHKKPGDWFDPPSIKSLASIALQVAGTIVGGPVAGALIGLIDDALFAMLDVAGGYKTPLEAGFEFGKQALMTAATSSLGGVYEGISKGIGGGISGVVGKTLVGAHQTITTGIVTSAIGAVNYSSEGGLSFSKDSFTAGVTSSFKGALTGAVGTFTGGMMSHFNLGENLSKVTGFSSGNINDMQKLNNTIGGLAGQAVGFAMGEDFKFNLLNLTDLTGGKASGGLLELSIGRKGVSAAIGSGGLDMSLGTIASTVRGAVAWDVNNKINATAKASKMETTTLANVLRYQYGMGDSTQRNQLFEVLAGNTVLQGSSGKKGEKAETVTADGKRVVTLAGYKEGMSAQEQMSLAIDLGHEAYRDGIVGPDNVLETREAVKGHTEMALRMTADKLYNKDAVALIGSNKNLQNDISAYAKGQDAFNAYVDGNYDSSADYWKLMKDGKLEYDGFATLRDADGNVIKSYKEMGLSSDNAIEGALLKIMNIDVKDAEAVAAVRKMMEGSGLKHSNSDNPNDWVWSGTHEAEVGIYSGHLPNVQEKIELMDLREANMGKTISIGTIAQVFDSTGTSARNIQNFFNNTYGSVIDFLNYAEKGEEFNNARQLVANIYLPSQVAMINANREWFNNTTENGININTMVIGDAKRSEEFGIRTNNLKLASSSVAGAAFFQEEHTGIDFGSGGTGIGTPGGFWEFTESNSHKAYYQLYGSSLKMRVQHLNEEELKGIKPNTIFGSITGTANMLNYPTESYGSGTGAHIHIDMTNRLPYNGSYTRQFVNPETLQPGNKLEYQYSYKDKDAQPLKGFPANFWRF